MDIQTDPSTESYAGLIDESGVSYGVKHINNKPRVSSMPYLFDIAEGNVTGHTAWSKTGYNPDVDTGTEDLWYAGGTYVWPTAEAQMEVYSNSERDQQQSIVAFATSDGGTKTKVSVTAAHGLTNTDKVIISGCATAAYNATHVIEQVSGDYFVIPVAYTPTAAAGIVRGPGVNVVTIYYLNLAGTEKSVDVTLGPVTAVATGAGAADIYRVQNFRAKTCGDSKKAVGTISLRAIADTPVYSTIGPGLTRARNSVFTVPAGKVLYITSARISSTGAASGKDAVVTYRTNYDDKSLVIKDFFMPFTEIGVMDGAILLQFEIPIKLPAGTDAIASATVKNNDTIVICALRGWMETA